MATTVTTTGITFPDATVQTTAARGADGAGGDEIFYLNDQVITTNYTLAANKNAMTAGPLTINTGITVTISTGATWVIV